VKPLVKLLRWTATMILRANICGFGNPLSPLWELAKSILYVQGYGNLVALDSAYFHKHTQNRVPKVSADK
jgi:hypothetical protein